MPCEEAVPRQDEAGRAGVAGAAGCLRCLSGAGRRTGGSIMVRAWSASDVRRSQNPLGPNVKLGCSGGRRSCSAREWVDVWPHVGVVASRRVVRVESGGRNTSASRTVRLLLRPYRVTGLRRGVSTSGQNACPCSTPDYVSPRRGFRDPLRATDDSELLTELRTLTCF